MKVLFFEDDFESMKAFIEWFNLRFYKNSLQISILVKTDTKTDFASLLNEYDKIFVDIGLAKASVDDGYGIVSKFRVIKSDIERKVYVITADKELANNKKSVELYGITILPKPLKLEDLKKAIRE